MQITKTYTCLPTGVKAIDESKGLVEAYVNSTAIKDFQMDVMEPGCYSGVVESIKATAVPAPAICWAHNTGVVTGKVIDIVELPPGSPALPSNILSAGAGSLKIIAQYNLETQPGREAFSNVKGGYISEWSVQFWADDKDVSYDTEGLRHINKVKDLLEVSNVLRGASPLTQTTMAKALPRKEPDVWRPTSMARIAQAKELEAELEKAKVKPTCTACGGTGKLPDGTPCTACDGTGYGAKEEPEVEGEDKKNIPMPQLSGDEARHLPALQSGLGAIDALIAQELAEGEPEYDCIIELASIANRLLTWGWNENNEYGPSVLAQMEAPTNESHTLDLHDAGADVWLMAAIAAAYGHPLEDPGPALDPPMEVQEPFDRYADRRRPPPLPEAS